MATTPTATRATRSQFLLLLNDTRLDMTSRTAVRDLAALTQAAATHGLTAVADRLTALHGADYPTLTSDLRTLARDLAATLDH